MSEPSELVLTERKGHVLLLTMNRPERHHALNRALTSRLAQAMEEAEQDGEVRVVILTGSGTKAFCAGADMLEVSGVEREPARESARESAREPANDRRISAVDAIGKFSNTPLPVIAAINGYCYGGGARLAVACDIRLASDTATFRLPGAEYGLVVAAATLPRLVGSSKAKELIFTARRFGAADALDWGLLSAVHAPGDLLAAAWSLAEEIAANSVAAVRESKRVIDAATLSAAADEMENAVNRELRGSPEQLERFRSATRKVTGR